MEKTRTQAVCVDLLKLIFAYCVVAIHTQAANKAPLYLQFWTALAVPFFFVCSGYYFQIKLNAVGHESVCGGGKELLRTTISSLYHLGQLVFAAGSSESIAY